MGKIDRGKRLKERVAREAVGMVRGGTIVGLGTGSTAALAIAELGKRVRQEGLEIIGIPTSYGAAMIARENGIAIRSFEDVSKIDIAIDGADEVDPRKNLIKGGGGAHTREKVVDGLADLFVVVVDDSKLVKHLGEKFPVPVEVTDPEAFPDRRFFIFVSKFPRCTAILGVDRDDPATGNSWWCAYSPEWGAETTEWRQFELTDIMVRAVLSDAAGNEVEAGPDEATAPDRQGTAGARVPN